MISLLEHFYINTKQAEHHGSVCLVLLAIFGYKLHIDYFARITQSRY